MGYKNPEDQKKFHKEWYKRNRARLIEKAGRNNTLYKQRNREFIWDLKRNGNCLDCKGRFPPEAMDFDHTSDNKLKTIARMVSEAVSLKRIKEEIAKCDLVCSNCHRVRTAKRIRFTDETVDMTDLKSVAL